MEHAAKEKVQTYTAESSVIPHEFSRPKNDQVVMPTWALLVILFAAFFILKTFIYIPDEPRKGK